MKRILKKTLVAFLALSMAISVTGCSSYIEETQVNNNLGVFPIIDKDQESSLVSMETEPVISYTVGQQVPGILVAQVGYSKTGDKVAIFQGSKLPGKYQVLDTESGKVVFEGQIETQQNENQTWLVGYGDFSEFETEGNYYIQCDYLGRSYSFSIEEKLYTGLMEELVKTLDDRPLLQFQQGQTVTDTEIIAQCRALSGILLAVELFPDEQVNKVNGLENKTPDVLEYVAEQVAALTAFQDTETGGVGKASAWYCAVLTKFSYSYQKYDSTFATKCLQAADKAWKYIDSNSATVQDAERYYAATELYRATGKNRYHSVAKELGKNFAPDIQNEALTYGGITYISTKWSLDKKLCNTFIKDLMAQAEDISAASKKATYLSNSLVTKGQSQKFFQNMLVMCVVDYVITNQEYAYTIERHHLYLGGRNEEGNSFLNYEICDTLSQTDLIAKPEFFGRYFLMLSELKSHE